MVSSEDLHLKLGNLSRIHGLASVDSGLEQLISSGKNEEADAEIARRLDAIRQISSVDSLSVVSSLWSPIKKERVLSSKEYVLPPEMGEIHSPVLADILSKNRLENLAYGGLILFGATVGTGKSDYFRFLAGAAKDKAKFVVANIDKITGSASPATMIKSLYHELDALAVKEGVKYVVLLDEFERLVNKHSKLHSATKTDSSSTSSESRHTSTETRTTENKLELDQVGMETYAALKTIISGGQAVDNVYTIATSNQSVFDEALTRRLRHVELKPVGISQINIERYRVPDYADYIRIIERTALVLQAAHYRSHGKPSAHVQKLYDQVQRQLEAVDKKHRVDPSKRKPKPREAHELTQKYIGSVEAQLAQRNNAFFYALMKFFNVKVPVVKDVTWSGDPYNIFASQFAGVFKEPIISNEGDQVRSHNDRWTGKGYAEVELANNLTPSIIAKRYLEHPNDFSTYDKTKRTVALLFFPQVAKYLK